MGLTAGECYTVGMSVDLVTLGEQDSGVQCNTCGLHTEEGPTAGGQGVYVVAWGL